MKTRLVALICLLNMMTLGAGFLWVSHRFDNRLDKEREATRVQLERLTAQAATPRVVSARPVVVYRTNAFNWSQIESTNYHQYIANLRAVGCPEITLRDIIITDIMRLYAERRGQFYQNGRPFKYWETDEKRKLNQKQLDEREAQVALIDKELPAVLRELLGINYEREVNKYFVDNSEDDRRFAFLSDDKREQVLELRDEFEGRRERLFWQAQDHKLTPEEIAELKQIDADQKAALNGVLTTPEMDEYVMTTSPAAERMRKELIGFNPTETEFREIFAREQALDDAYAYADPDDPDTQAAKAADEQKMTASIRESLGAYRAAQLDQARSPDYQSLTVLAARFELPEGVQNTILDMRREAEDARLQVLSDASIPADRRTEALNAIQTETEKAARSVLGDQAYAEYARGAEWVRGTRGN